MLKFCLMFWWFFNTLYIYIYILCAGFHRKRRYFYTSFFREPVTRFISEYRHVERGATWLAARHICNGRPPTPEQLPMCFDPEIGWDGVTMDEFLACPYNLAFNRYVCCAFFCIILRSIIMNFFFVVKGIAFLSPSSRTAEIELLQDLVKAQ